MKFFDQNDLSRRWGLSVRTLERYRLEGTGPRYVRIGRLIRYRECDIDEFENDNARSSTSQLREVRK